MWPVLHRGGGGETGNAHEMGRPRSEPSPPRGGGGGSGRAGPGQRSPGGPACSGAARAGANTGHQRVWGPTRSQLLAPLALRVPLDASDVLQYHSRRGTCEKSSCTYPVKIAPCSIRCNK